VAQDSLTRATAAVSILALGVVGEVAAPQSAALTAADFAVGAGLGCGGAYLLGRAPRPACLALAAAVAWFAGTLEGASSGALSGLGAVLLIAYRGPLLHLLLGVASGRLVSRPARTLASAGWLASVLPLPLAGPATSALAAVIAAHAGVSARRAAAGRTWVLTATAAVAALLATLWALASLGVGSETALLALNDAAVACAALIALSAAAGWWTRGTARAVAVELGPLHRPGQPLTVRLGRALADPDLEIRYALDGEDWVDEQGRPAPVPGIDGRQVTRVDAPQGGEVALVHGRNAAPDPRLAAAAAAAAALALDTARLEADARRRAVEIQASRLRLLGVADAERQSLEQRLSDGALARLRRVERLLADHGETLAPERAELREAMRELLALARGLYPTAVDRADLALALTDVAARSPIPTTVEVQGDLGTLPETHRAAIWFMCSEALANVVRHAHASRAAVIVQLGDEAVVLEIRDDGRGGATLRRGLRGLADRVDALGGTFVLSSPAGGPTAIRIRLPISTVPGAGSGAGRLANSSA
jgi:signal transduction histidine kinase